LIVILYVDRRRYLIYRKELKDMSLKRSIKLLIISFLVFGVAGGVSIVAAEETNLHPGYLTDPDFFSPTWKPAKITTSYSDPYFFNSNWSGKSSYWTMNNEGTNPANWKTPIYRSMSDPDFLYSNWSAHTPVLFRYSGIDSSRMQSLDLDPFASDDELRAQGWTIQGDFWQAWN
jgi:hypothetical protein